MEFKTKFYGKTAKDEEAARLFIFEETRTESGLRAYIVKGLKRMEAEIRIPSEYRGGAVVRIENRAFSGSSFLTKVEIPHGLSSIGIFSFAFCAALTELELPDCVSVIGRRAFYGCGSLKNISFGSGLRRIGNGAFIGCRELREIVLPVGLTSIGKEAFSYCHALERVTIGGGVTSLGQNTFNECGNLREICYDGTRKQWNFVKKDDIFGGIPHEVALVCTDGTICLH